jgi:hypothetical protein
VVRRTPMWGVDEATKNGCLIIGAAGARRDVSASNWSGDRGWR